MSKLGRIDISKCMSNGSKEIWNHIDAGTLTTVDYEVGRSLREKIDVSSLAGCTAAATIDESGDVIVGRNEDLSISNYPIYTFYIDTGEPGTYKTLNVNYNFVIGPTVPEINERGAGLTEEEKSYLPFFAGDVLNEKGFFIESNMRNEEYREDGSSLFINNGTNPDADVTVCTLHLTRYLGDHCATIAEALELLKKINVTDDDATNLGWNVCFLMADATGAYGVLEIAQDEVIFSEGCHCQANFYIADKFLNQAKYFDGLGRYTKVMKCIDDVRNLDDFNQLMHSVRYSGIFDDSNDDWDNIGDISADFEQSTQWMLVHRYDEAVLHRRHELMHYFDDWTEEEIADSRMKWNTTYRTLVNCNTLQMTVVCNEDLEQRVLLGF